MKLTTYIVTVTAEDRVGIVHCVTGTIRDQGGNILELSQTVMRGYFTIILAAAFTEPPGTEVLREAIEGGGQRFGLTVAVLEAAERARVPAVPDGERFLLTVLGPDQVGTIHGISGCLADQGVNIVDLHARADGAKFSMVMEAFLPPDLPPGTLRAELERFGRGRGLESYVQHENIFLATSEPRPVRVGPAPNPEGRPAVVPH
jgi:glycine cleavage system transcriptional repressor